MKNKEHLSPEIIAAARDLAQRLAPEVLGISFADVFEAYKQENPRKKLTETDLVSEILEAGEYQNEGDAALEDVVMFGLIAMGS